MNPRLLRSLIRLFPREWRRRYGEELRDLVAELAHHGEETQARLAIELIARAVAERISRPGLRAVTGLMAVAAVVAVVSIALSDWSSTGNKVLALDTAQGQHDPGAAARHPRPAPTLQIPHQSGQSCFVTSGSTCSAQPHSCPVSSGSDCAETACPMLISAGETGTVPRARKTARSLEGIERTLATAVPARSACAPGETIPVTTR